MKTVNKKNLYHCFSGLLAALILTGVADAAVVARGNTRTSTRSPNRLNNADARAVLTTTQSQQPIVTDTAAPDTAIDTATTTPATPVIIDKTNQFEAVMSTTQPSTDTSAEARAEMIRRQRAALDADATKANTTTKITRGINTCDASLRKCMQDKCGTDFTKCSGDTDTTWGGKMDACRRNIECSGTEYSLFAAEIKADRDANANIASYNEIINCGNQYNSCIVTECGQKFSKCLGKSAGDAAISKCASIAKKCTQQDSGLAARVMSVFGTLRQNAEVRVKQDEERLYALRDAMRTQCERLGAMFDERTLDCVYTVNFFANNSATPYASKKAYAGGVFDCTPTWFGIDVTTFMENAMRLTRSQSSASASMMGAGAGVAVGALTSGAIDRAVDRHKAETALKKAEKSEKKAKNESDPDLKKIEEYLKKAETESGIEINGQEEQAATATSQNNDTQQN